MFDDFHIAAMWMRHYFGSVPLFSLLLQVTWSGNKHPCKWPSLPHYIVHVNTNSPSWYHISCFLSVISLSGLYCFLSPSSFGSCICIHHIRCMHSMITLVAELYAFKRPYRAVPVQWGPVNVHWIRGALKGACNASFFTRVQKPCPAPSSLCRGNLGTHG